MLVTSRAHLRRGRAWPCLLQWKSSSNAEFLVVWWIGLLWVSHPETAGHPQFQGRSPALRVLVVFGPVSLSQNCSATWCPHWTQERKVMGNRPLACLGALA